MMNRRVSTVLGLLAASAAVMVLLGCGHKDNATMPTGAPPPGMSATPGAPAGRPTVGQMKGGKAGGPPL